jgi:hypothetical protein
LKSLERGFAEILLTDQNNFHGVGVLGPGFR